MALLEAWEIDEMRSEAVADFVPDLCTIYTPPAASPYEGEETTVLYPDGWTAVASDIACRLSVPTAGGGAEQMEAAGVKATAGFIIHLDWATASPLAISKQSRVRVTSQNNRDFEVKGIPDVSENMTRILQVEERT